MPTIQSVTIGPQNESTTVTCSVPVNAGDNLAIVAAIHIEAAGDDCTAMSRDGQSLVEHGTIFTNAWSRAELWKLVNPNLGTTTLSATIGGAGGKRGRLVVWVLEDVDQDTPLRASDFNWGDAGVSSSINAPGVQATDLVIDAITLDAQGHSPVVGALQFAQYNGNSGSNGAFEMAGSEQDGADGAAMSWSWTTSTGFSHIAVAVVAAPPNMQKIHPDGDIVTTGWSTAPLWSKIEEETADGTVISGTAS